MSKIHIVPVFLFSITLSQWSHGFDLFKNKSISPDRLQYVTDFLGEDIMAVKCPEGFENKKSDLKTDMAIYLNRKICLGKVGAKSIKIELDAFGGSIIGMASSTINQLDDKDCSKVRRSADEYEKAFFKSGRPSTATNGIAGFFDVQKNGILHKRIFSCSSEAAIWVVQALPLDLDFKQWGTETKNKLMLYSVGSLDSIKSTVGKAGLDLTSMLALYQKDLDIGFPKNEVEKIRSSIKSNSNHKVMLKIFEDAVDATLNINKAREFLKTNSSK